VSGKESTGLSGAPLAAIVSVGNELLFGETVDTNAAWLGRVLARTGVSVVRRFTVGDVREAIQGAVAAATGAAELVIVSGGLGPTADDITRESVAAHFGRPLHRDPELVDALTERFLSRGYSSLPATNLSQCDVPEGARILRNPLGMAPGLAIVHTGGVVALLPGVPEELRRIYSGDLSDLVQAHFGGRLLPVEHRMMHLTGIPESRLGELVEETLAADPDLTRAAEHVSIAYLPDLRGVDIRLSARGREATDTSSALDRLERGLDHVLAKWRFRSESGDLAEAVVDVLRSQDMTLATAESCTAGLIAKRLTDHAGASDVFIGGVVAYHDSLKTDALGVSEEALERHGAVSEPVAIQMARGVVERCGADVGLAVTGVAGPGGGSFDKPVGRVWLAVSIGSEVTARSFDFMGDRTAIRERAAQAALALVLRAIEQRRPRA